MSFHEVLLSPEDEHLRSRITLITKTGYPKCGIRFLHQLILKPHPTLFIDHKDRNKLNCRRDNLRYVTHTENNRNAGLRKNNISGIKGVCFQKRFNLWEVRVGNGIRTTLYHGPDFFLACCARKSWELRNGYST